MAVAPVGARDARRQPARRRSRRRRRARGRARRRRRPAAPTASSPARRSRSCRRARAGRRASASVIAREPPRGDGPAVAVAGADQRHARPTALIGRVSGLKAWAATRRTARGPAASASARASAVAGSAAAHPEARQPERVARHVQHRAQEVLGERVEAAERRAEERAARPTPSAPSPAAVSVDRAQHHARAAVVERVGAGRPRASATRGRGARGRASAGTGSRRAIGWTAEHSSCSSPGSVSSALRVPPPIASLRPRAPSRSTPCARERRRAGQPVRAGADDDRVAHATPRAAGAAPVRVTSTGKSQDSSSHGCALDHVGDVDLALLDQPGRRVVDAGSAGAAMWAGWDSSATTRSSPGSKPHCSWTASSSCWLWKCPSPKFQPTHHAGDHLALAHVVVVDVRRRRAGAAPLSARPWVCIERKASPFVEQYSAVSAAVELGQLLDDDRAPPCRRRSSSFASAPVSLRNSHWLVAQLPA